MKIWATVALVSFGFFCVPLGAQSYTAFGARPSAAFGVQPFTDQEVSGFIGTLDRLIAAAPAAVWRDKAGDALWQFARRLQAGRLSREQESRVLAHLDGIARTRLEGAALVAGPRKMISTLTVGKQAPEVAGRDLDGKPFKLSDYRGKVVLLVFSAEWCAICHAQAPYERFLLDRYAKWPFAVLGVQTGSSRESARAAQLTSPVAHRAWWDEPAAGKAGGPIASIWNVVGWPASYLIDPDGVIQFVDVREENLLIAVRQLLESQIDREARTSRRK